MNIIKTIAQATCQHRFKRIAVFRTKGRAINVYKCVKCNARWEEITNENISK